MSLAEVSMSPLLLQGCFHSHKDGAERTRKGTAGPRAHRGGSQSAIAWTWVAYRARQKSSLPRWMWGDRIAQEPAGAKSHSQMNKTEKNNGLSSQEFLTYTPLGHHISIRQPALQGFTDICYTELSCQQTHFPRVCLCLYLTIKQWKRVRFTSHSAHSASSNNRQKLIVKLMVFQCTGQ